jgi:hypothetical protein
MLSVSIEEQPDRYPMLKKSHRGQLATAAAKAAQKMTPGLPE